MRTVNQTKSKSEITNMDATIEKISRKTGKLLKKSKQILVTAESCTGGLIAGAITAIPGSSDWFDCGFVTYSNHSKSDFLKVRPKTIDQHGAVSQETAKEMAEGALKHSKATVSLAVTGIAGPTGGTKEKPVGTVCFAWASRHKPTLILQKFFKGDRTAIRKYSVIEALNGLLRFL